MSRSEVYRDPQNTEADRRCFDPMHIRGVRAAAAADRDAEAVRILFAGDVMLGRFVNEMLKHEPAAYPWGDTLPLFGKADWRVCNLECAVPDHGKPWSESAALCETLRLLDEAGILHCGLGGPVRLAGQVRQVRHNPVKTRAANH